MKIKFTNQEKSLILKHWIDMPSALEAKFQQKHLQYIDVPSIELKELIAELLTAILRETECNRMILAKLFLSLTDRTHSSQLCKDKEAWLQIVH